MQAHDLADLMQQQARSGKLYLEFVRVPSLSVGLYSLPVGGTDPQQPHTEDEVYVVMQGRGEIIVGGEVRVVEAGSVVYVPANVEHRFRNIAEDLQVLVFFAPAEYSLRQS